MGVYLLRRLLHSLVVLTLISVATFLIVHLSPGGPEVLYAGDLPPSERQYIIRNLGLDQPLHVQFTRWFGALLRGDFGRSFNQQRAVLDLIRERLPASLVLAGASLVVAVVVGVPLGVAAARRPNSWVDYWATGVSVLGVSIPTFWLGIVLILLFSVRWRLLPSAGMATVGVGFSIGDLVSHLIMPAFVLSLVYLAQIASYTRASLLDVMGRDYVRTARAKGLREVTVLVRHALRNGLIPVVTVIGLLIPRLVGGAAITETIFSWPGMGRLAVEAALKRDYPVVMGITVIFAVAVIASSLVVDVLYGLVDPRVKIGAADER
ncbi:MAG: ABC transporter permease [Armatimonadota bacterium]